MILRIQSDGSHHWLPGAKSVAEGIFYVANNDDPPDKVNGAIDTICKVIDKSVTASAAETEYAKLFKNGQKGCLPLQVLNDLGYSQHGPTTVFSDNLVAKGTAFTSLWPSNKNDHNYDWRQLVLHLHLFQNYSCFGIVPKVLFISYNGCKTLICIMSLGLISKGSWLLKKVYQ